MVEPKKICCEDVITHREQIKTLYNQRKEDNEKHDKEIKEVHEVVKNINDNTKKIYFGIAGAIITGIINIGIAFVS